MKTLSTEFQQELISWLEGLDEQTISEKAYFLEELRPKRVRKKLAESLDLIQQQT